MLLDDVKFKVKVPENKVSALVILSPAKVSTAPNHDIRDEASRNNPGRNPNVQPLTHPLPLLRLPCSLPTETTLPQI
jgi:hypothetical protein